MGKNKRMAEILIEAAEILNESVDLKFNQETFENGVINLAIKNKIAFAPKKNALAKLNELKEKISSDPKFTKSEILYPKKASTPYLVLFSGDICIEAHYIYIDPSTLEHKDGCYPYEKIIKASKK